MSRAEARQILSTEIVLERSRTTFETTAIAPFKAKGKAEPVRASVVGPVAGTRDDRQAETPLIGRDVELGALLDVLEHVRQGHGWIIEISGGAGLGKSRLVRELFDRARDVVVLHSRCEEYESSTPYFALRAPVRTVLGIDPHADTPEVEARLREVVTPGRPDARAMAAGARDSARARSTPTPETASLDPRFLRERLADVTMRLLVSSLAGTPTMLAVEDVHHMDEASTDLLRRLSRAGSALRQVLLVTHSDPARTWAPTDDEKASARWRSPCSRCPSP